MFLAKQRAAGQSLRLSEELEPAPQVGQGVDFQIDSVAHNPSSGRSQSALPCRKVYSALDTSKPSLHFFYKGNQAQSPMQLLPETAC
ncbi:hypothetical protein SKAU_G00266310 [Synaphobranchus kaupii]|uniref:Uncharacterized protein n=1 Tax=Synaphobranchus kaupii TaxID=118154 RepID=A0A9Q1EZD8_SYNKA|nr:hypothetical protein SKAU_G00266310 [Synaphobranchus kaupii]